MVAQAIDVSKTAAANTALSSAASAASAANSVAATAAALAVAFDQHWIGPEARFVSYSLLRFPFLHGLRAVFSSSSSNTTTVSGLKKAANMRKDSTFQPSGRDVIYLSHLPRQGVCGLPNSVAIDLKTCARCPLFQLSSTYSIWRTSADSLIDSSRK